MQNAFKFDWEPSHRFRQEGMPMVDESLLSSVRGIVDKLKGWLLEACSKVVDLKDRIVGHIKNQIYWIAFSKRDSKALATQTPYTLSQAYQDIKSLQHSAVVVPTREVSRATGLRRNFDSAYKLYGNGTTLDYYKAMGVEGVKESAENLSVNQIDERLSCEVVGGGSVNEVKLSYDNPNVGDPIDTKELMEEVEMYITSSPSDKSKPLLIWGAPGIGKTEIVKAVVKSVMGEDYNFIVRTLSTSTRDSFFLPKYDTDANGKTVVIDVPKSFLPVYKKTGDDALDAEADAACGEGVLFVDELSRATPDVLNVILPLLTYDPLDGYQLGSGWKIIAASNRLCDEEDGQSRVGNAVLNRFAQLYYEPTCKSWMEWAKTKKYISPMLMRFFKIGQNSTKYFYYDPNEEDGGISDNPCTLIATPRSWEAAMRELCRWNRTADMEGWKLVDMLRDHGDNLIKRCMCKYIPSNVVTEFLEMLHTFDVCGEPEVLTENVLKGNGADFTPEHDFVCSSIASWLIMARHPKMLSEEEFRNVCKWAISINSYTFAHMFIEVLCENYEPQGLGMKYASIMARYKYDKVLANYKEVVDTNPTDKAGSRKKDTAILEYNNYTKGMYNDLCRYMKVQPDEYPDYLKVIQEEWGASGFADIINAMQDAMDEM